jgi:UDPglucose--hexose-1-phosphate uridylyltransferase
MSELRQDPTTGRSVIIAPQRQLRPGAQPLARRAEMVARPAFDPHCPFCDGNETSLPGIVAETKTDAPPHWAVRVVPNKFPILSPEAKARPADRHHVQAGFGIHEIIIETPRHDGDLATATDFEIEAVVSSYRDRSRQLLAQPGIEAVIVFRNHGRQSGASLSHPHSQVLAVGFVPPLLGMLADWGRHRFETTGRCPTCEEIAIERDLGTRVIDDTQQFLVIVPFAAAHPSEMWIVPKQHQASFLEIDDAQANEFARLLRRTLGRLRRARDDPPYNFVIDSAARCHLGSPFAHWRLRIAPDLATSGGFELGAGTPVNPSRPEDDAAVLRAAAIDRDSLP